MPDQQPNRDFMREGELLFDWEKVALNKRRAALIKDPSFEEEAEEMPTSLPNPAESRGLLTWFRERFGSEGN